MIYAYPARLLHWIMAAGFAFMWACGFTMTTLVTEDSLVEETLRGLHVSAGVTLAALWLVRVGVRLTNKPPPSPMFSRLERSAAQVVHMALYALPLAVIAAGWSGSRFVEWFGVGLPTLGLGEPAEELAETLHMWLAYTFLAVAAGHVLAALKHQWWDDHDILDRMTGRPG